jgi:DNA transformation protein
MDFDFIRDLFAQFRPVTVKRMFSGAGIYCDGVMFALVVRHAILSQSGRHQHRGIQARRLRPFHLHAWQDIGPPQRTRFALLAIARSAL